MSKRQRMLVAAIGPSGFRSEEWITKKAGKEITHRTIASWDEDLWRTPYGWRAMWKEIITMFKALYSPLIGEYFLLFATFDFKKNRRDEYLEWAHILRELPLPIRVMIWVHKFKGRLVISPLDPNIYEELMEEKISFTELFETLGLEWRAMMNTLKSVNISVTSLDTLNAPFIILRREGDGWKIEPSERGR